MEKNAWDTRRRGLNEHARDPIVMSRQEVGVHWYRRADGLQARSDTRFRY